MILIGCENHPSNQKHKHLIIVNSGGYSESYYATTELKYHDNCITFRCIDPWDFEGEVERTICGSFIIKY